MEISQEIRWYGHTLDSTFQHIRLIFLSDVHYGNQFSSVKHFLRARDFIAKYDDVFCVLNGDLCESVIKTSKGEIFKQVGTPQDQRDYFIEEALPPIKHKILGMTAGNHENRIYRDVGIDICKDIAKHFHVPYNPDGIMLKISFGDGNNYNKGKPFVFWSYCTHGYGGARTKSAKAVKLERTASYIHADVYAMSHDHVVNVSPDVYLVPDQRGYKDIETGFTTGKVSAHRSMMVKTNAFLKWGGYSESGGYSPSDLATPVVYLLTPQSEYWNLCPDKPQQAVKVLS